ncbi:MAG: hypothetical protein IPJ61_20165 [Tessaracoccus sp.]|uniref:hypothetical protein n=1 Tax=Tessaracoccus sp. TaxID=1971211 RepID=UPI001EC96D58|nr:hypothetical protein [Tessaracoccus sp.]MBK7823303.1 hypothetical protein [Tessaracoccus sp.]
MKLIDSLRVQLMSLMAIHPVIAYKLFSEVWGQVRETNGEIAYIHLRTLEDREIAVLFAGGFIRGGEGFEKTVEPIVVDAIQECVQGVNTSMEIV